MPRFYPPTIDVGPYTIHLAVAVARLRRWWRRARTGIVASAALVFASVAAWQIIPWLHGAGVVVIDQRPSDAAIWLDDRMLPDGPVTLPAGVHMLRIERAGFYPATLTVTVPRDETVTVPMPSLRPLPQIIPIEPPAPMQWRQAHADGNGVWRVVAESVAPPAAPPGAVNGMTVPSEQWLLRFDRAGMIGSERMDPARPVAERILPSGVRVTARWDATPVLSYGRDAAAGTLTITALHATATITTAIPVRALAWDHHSRFLAIAYADGDRTAIAILNTMLPSATWEASSASFVADVAGSVETMHWHPDGSAVLVVTRQAATSPWGSARAAVVVRLTTTPPHVITLRPPPDAAAGILRMAWDDDALWWVADTGLGSLALEHVSLTDGSVTRHAMLDRNTMGIGFAPDGTMLTAACTAQGSIVLRTTAESATEWPLPAITVPFPCPMAAAAWNEDRRTMLVASDTERLWMVDLAPEVQP